MLQISVAYRRILRCFNPAVIADRLHRALTAGQFTAGGTLNTILRSGRRGSLLSVFS
ncbi:hypothetical protein ACNKHV_26510 [Shigella flexneri]